MPDKVNKAVEALRKKENDKIIKWEAEIIYSLEKYKNECIINELTDDISIYEYIGVLLPKIDFKLSLLLEKWLDSSEEYTREYIIKRMNLSEGQAEHLIKIKSLVKYITTIKNSSVYLEKEKIRKENINKECISDTEDVRALEKKKEIEEIKKQIAELQAKLALLQM
jgi:hypothetical protein